MRSIHIDRRKLLAAASLLAVWPMTAQAQAQRSLKPILQRYRKVASLPGLAALVLDRGGIVARGAVGLRRADQRDRLTLGDPFMIGSCGKAMTATLVGRLIERKQLRWRTTIAEVFPELAAPMRKAYRGVTVHQLLCHRSGLPDLDAVADDQIPELARLSPRKARRAALPLILSLPPAATPGIGFHYSNLGYLVVGAIAEQVTGIAFETLMARELFSPLRLRSAGFLAPTGAGVPWAHAPDGTPLPPDSSVFLPPLLSPAGLVHLNLVDWARFIAVHLGRGPIGYLAPQSLAALHAAYPGPGPSYAAGWLVVERAPLVLAHYGSDDYWYAAVAAEPAGGRAVLAATNIASTAAEIAIRTLISELAAGIER